ncbi:long-chain acyl-CoA synthetase [Lachnospiraceae bacterium NE2001]|nr:long-chain acyl-CoA synthetase [Lachnospiraceae bacterium NE2001]
MKNKAYPYCTPPQMNNLKEMINRLAVEKADDTAFVYPCESGEMHKTYYDFKEDVYAFGAWMYSKKIIDKHVAIVGENSYEWLVVFLAAVCSGNTALGIDKGLPDEEIIGLAKIGEADVAFATDTYFKKVEKKAAKKAYNLKDLEDILTEGRKLIREGKGKAFEDYEIELDKTAAILFTSGTSGVSKGVELTNRNIAYEIVHTSMLYEPYGGVLAVLPFHHALGLVVGILMVINYGQPIYINKSLKYVKKNMEEFGPQTMFLVPMFVEFFHKQIWAEVAKKGKTQAFKGLMKSTDILLKAGVDVRKKTYGSIQKVFGGNLEYIICGGAALDPMYVKEFRTWGIEILNGYGATECSPCTAVNRQHFRKDGSVGQLVPGIEVKTTDEGELCFKGDLVMKGYYKNPEATAEALEDGWYHTGDLGYVDDDDFIYLTGRKKNLIILSNGENISPEELEMDIARDDAVQEVLVYDEDGKIVAEIFPVEEHFGDTEYFEKLKNKVNKGRPLYKQVARVKLREEEFIKNASMKIVRYKNIPGYNK